MKKCKSFLHKIANSLHHRFKIAVMNQLSKVKERTPYANYANTIYTL